MLQSDNVIVPDILITSLTLHSDNTPVLYNLIMLSYRTFW